MLLDFHPGIELFYTKCLSVVLCLTPPQAEVMITESGLGAANGMQSISDPTEETSLDSAVALSP